MVRVKFPEQFGLYFWPPTGPITVFLKLYLTATGLSSPPALCSSGRNERPTTNIRGHGAGDMFLFTKIQY